MPRHLIPLVSVALLLPHCEAPNNFGGHLKVLRPDPLNGIFELSEQVCQLFSPKIQKLAADNVAFRFHAHHLLTINFVGKCALSSVIILLI
jgi:hypothetical protein